MDIYWLPTAKSQLVHVEFKVDETVLVQVFSSISYHFTGAPYTYVVRGLYSRKMITLKTDQGLKSDTLTHTKEIRVGCEHGRWMELLASLGIRGSEPLDSTTGFFLFKQSRQQYILISKL